MYRGRSQGSNYTNIRKLQRIHARRSKRAKRIDESLRAPLAKTSEQWLENPNRFDVPDVDTPKHREQPQKRKSEPNLEPTPQPTFQHSNLAQVRMNLARHKLYGTTH